MVAVRQLISLCEGGRKGFAARSDGPEPSPEQSRIVGVRDDRSNTRLPRRLLPFGVCQLGPDDEYVASYCAESVVAHPAPALGADCVRALGALLIAASALGAESTSSDPAPSGAAAPEGLHYAGFLLRPELGLSLLYDSNIFATRNNEIDVGCCATDPSM